MSEYNMSHTGEQLDDAINKVKSGYVLPTGTTEITSNGEHDVSKYKTAKVNVPKEGNAVQEVLKVSAEFNFSTGQAENFSHTYAEIVQAFNDGKVIKLVASYGSDDEPQHAIGDLIHYREDEKVLEFAVFVYSNILTADHELHHFRIVMNEDNTTQTTIAVLSGGSEAVQETMLVTGKLVLGTIIDVQDLSHTHEQIWAALSAKKVVKMMVNNSATGRYYFAEASVFSHSSSLIQFVGNIKDNFGYGELPYLIFISINSNNTVGVDINIVNVTSA